VGQDGIGVPLVAVSHTESPGSLSLCIDPSPARRVAPWPNHDSQSPRT
jgi:hypothetical protein